MSSAQESIIEEPILINSASRFDYEVDEPFVFSGKNRVWLQSHTPTKFGEQGAQSDLIIFTAIERERLLNDLDTDIYEAGHVTFTFKHYVKLISQVTQNPLFHFPQLVPPQPVAIDTVAETIAFKVDALFRAAKVELFEDEEDSRFSRELDDIVDGYGNQAISAISRVIFSEDVDGELASVALRQLGMMDDLQTAEQRLELIQSSLNCPSPWIRYGAVLALSWINDASAIPRLQQAIEKEEISELRRTMEKVLVQLGNLLL